MDPICRSAFGCPFTLPGAQSSGRLWWRGEAGNDQEQGGDGELDRRIACRLDQCRQCTMCFRKLVPGAGLEPALPFGNQILSLERLPFRHPGQGQISSGEIGRTVSSWRASLARPAIPGHGLLFWHESRLTWAGSRDGSSKQKTRPLRGRGPVADEFGRIQPFRPAFTPSARRREFPRVGRFRPPPGS